MVSHSACAKAERRGRENGGGGVWGERGLGGLLHIKSASLGS